MEDSSSVTQTLYPINVCCDLTFSLLCHIHSWCSTLDSIGVSWLIKESNEERDEFELEKIILFVEESSGEGFIWLNFVSYLIIFE